MAVRAMKPKTSSTILRQVYVSRSVLAMPKRKLMPLIDIANDSALVLRERYRRDFTAFCREKLKIIDKNDPSGSALVPFEFNRCQVALEQLIEKIGGFNEERSRMLNERDPKVPISKLPIQVVVLKARKVGVSTYLEARAFWRSEFWPHTNTLVMAHERPAAQNIADIAHRFDVFWNANEEPIIRTPIERSSDDMMEWHPEHDSRFCVKTAGHSSGGSAGSTRSFTFQFCHFSEIAFFPADSEQLAAALSARVKFHETYLESTANGEGNIFHDAWVNSLWFEEVERLWQEKKPFPKWWNGQYKFFWPWWQDEGNRIPLLEHEANALAGGVDEDEEKLIAELGIELDQLAWRRAKIADDGTKQSALSPKDFFKQEHPSTPEEAFVGKSKAVFDLYKLKLMLEASREIKPVFIGQIVKADAHTGGFQLVATGAIEGAGFVQWELPRVNASYVIGVDSAEGLAHGDWSVVSVMDRTDGTALREVARFRAKTSAEELGEVAAYLGWTYNDAYVVAERNPPGNVVCLTLVRLGYTNLYHARNVELFSDRENPEAFTAGFNTNRSTKPLLVHRGITALRDNTLLLRSEIAIGEWRIFSNEDGKYGAPDGRNDDCVIADLLAVFGHGEAPPVWAAEAVEQVRLHGEAAQNEFWQLRLKKLRDGWAERNAVWTKRREGLEQIRRKHGNPFA